MDEKRDLEFSIMANSTIVYRSPRPTASLSVLEVGKQTVRSLIDQRTLWVFAAVLVESGCGMLQTSPSGIIPCAAPCLLWLVPGIAHSYGPLEGSSWDERWVLFDGSLAIELLEQGLIDVVEPVTALPGNSDIPQLFRDLDTELLMRSPLGDSAAAATVVRIATRAAIEGELRAPGDPRRDVEMVSALRTRSLSTIDLAAFARDFGISPATLRRRFIAATGLPPKVFQLRVRIDRAKELLTTTDKSIEHVASDVGFEDSFYFSRVFLQREKRTPSEFRRLNHRR
jgi:AraC family transcriptional regulator of arabinose operon